MSPTLNELSQEEFEGNFLSFPMNIHAFAVLVILLYLVFFFSPLECKIHKVTRHKSCSSLYVLYLASQQDIVDSQSGIY